MQGLKTFKTYITKFEIRLKGKRKRRSIIFQPETTKPTIRRAEI